MKSSIMSDADSTPALRIESLGVSIRSDDGLARILDDINLTIPKGRIVGVVGESGCGKSTLIRSILGILPEGASVDRGSIRFYGTDLLGLSQREMSRRIRGKEIGFIPQDPYLAFNPVFKVGRQLLEIMRWHGESTGEAGGKPTREDRRRHREQLIELLRIVQIPDAENALERYPHQFSGGQRQRLLIAGALSCRPKLLIADEPTTALDVTTQLQILRLLKKLSDELDISMLFVTHDFGVVAQLCDEVSVIYAGQTAESGTVREILRHPRHPYTRLLVDCHPDRSADLVGIPGTVPSPVAPPAGCRFHPRCPEARPVCEAGRPEAILQDEHSVNCVLYRDGAQTMDAARGSL